MATKRALRSREIARDLQIIRVLEGETQFSRVEKIRVLAPRVEAVQKRLSTANMRETSWIDKCTDATVRAEMDEVPPIDVDYMAVVNNVEGELAALEQRYP